jgi:hypothetical protein
LDQFSVTRTTPHGPNAGFLSRVRLRWVAFALTLAAVGAFALLAVLDPRAAPIALAGALLMAGKGFAWLVVLRRKRRTLARHGYRW